MVDPIVRLVMPSVDRFPKEEVIKVSIAPSAETLTEIVPVVKMVVDELTEEQRENLKEHYFFRSTFGRKDDEKV